MHAVKINVRTSGVIMNNSLIGELSIAAVLKSMT